MFKGDWSKRESGEVWQNFPAVIPFAIIDTRIVDLAMNFFERPDENLLTAYRRLEDIVRKRAGSREHGSRLFNEVFLSRATKLGWNELEPGEQDGRASLFTAAYKAHRNPRAHRELGQQSGSQLSEFLLLNHLYLLERQARDLRDDSTGDS